jgi:hypothetical protein
MHEVLHVAILVSTVTGAAGLGLLLVWPLVADRPLSPPARAGLLGMAGLAAILFLLEWRVVH